MNIFQKLHLLHSAWHYRLNTEKDDINFLLSLNLTDKTVIDIGANKGIYSYWMCKKVGPKGRVIAFEPQPELETHLLDFKQSFKFDNLSIINKGLSNVRGTGTLTRPEVGSGGATLGVNENSRNWQALQVELVTLDSFCDKLADVQFIKCDVEGHELNVFKGGQNLLERDKPCLLFECHHEDAKKQDLFLYLTSLGYKGFFSHRKKMIPFKEFNKYPYRRENEHHRNYIFVHPDFIKTNRLENQFTIKS